ncbi:MAG: DUF1549 domain-containing protein [Fuerstiella sp.]
MTYTPRLCRSAFPAALLLVALLLTSVSAGQSGEISPEHRTFFENRIRPVLVKHCYECHSHAADTLSADYALDTRDGLRGGSAAGDVAVIPGDPANSPLLLALRYSSDALQMPPEEQLPESVIADFEQWIRMGAPDPRTEDPEVLRRRAREASAGKLWSLQPPLMPDLPAVSDTAWPRSAIDRFVLARLEARDLHPVADADPRKLVRRVHFDLTGLPPAPDVVESFTANPTPSAYAKLVDELLASPHFGERWGRHWLDLARYAESSGMEFNFTYPHAWPYRNYVIDSFNKDKPYDRFLTEQLAGDLLPADSAAERDENNLATGFLAIGPKRHNAGTTEFRMDIVDDQIRATSEAMLGLTVGCARCHDHKFDPVPTADYYALAGIFLSTKTLHGTTKIKYSRHPSELVAFGPDADERHQQCQDYQKKLKEAEKQLSDREAELKKLKREEQKQAETDVQNLKKQVAQLKANAPEPPRYGMGASEGEPSDTSVAVGGDPGSKGDTVPRGFLSCVKLEQLPEVPETASGRLELARWITARDNPLTARVFANRVWHHLFGRGLVPSVNNFGVLGERPSHPQLLDYLAVRFMDDGWSVRKLIRRTVLSRAYQLSTRKDADLYRADPENTLVWRMTPKRLEIEPLRDAILAVSGRLDRSRPDGSPVTALGQQLARGVAWEKLNPPSHHRTVYLPVVRLYASHMHQEFDFAASSLVVGDRAETTTSQQALFFLNNEFVLEQSGATASLLIERHPENVEQQLRLGWQRALSRQPTAAELQVVQDYLKRTANALADEYEDAEERHQVALASYIQTLFGSAEFRYLLHAPAPLMTAHSTLTKADAP